MPRTPHDTPVPAPVPAPVGVAARRDWYQLEERHGGVMRARMVAVGAVALLAMGGVLAPHARGGILLASLVVAAAQALLWWIPRRSARWLRLCVDLSIGADVAWATCVAFLAGGAGSDTVWLLALVGVWCALGYSSRTGVMATLLASLAMTWLTWDGGGAAGPTDDVLLRIGAMWAFLAIVVMVSAAGERELRRRADRVEALHDLAQRLLAATDAQTVRTTACESAERLMPGWGAAWGPGVGGPGYAPRLERGDGRLRVVLPVPGDGGDGASLVLDRPQGRGPGRVRERDLLALQAVTAETGSALWRLRLTADLERRALTDGLTGLVNRRGYDDALARSLAEADRRPGWVSLCIIDVDRFKDYNDRHGHAAGDDALRAVATALRGVVRAGDTVARHGGEEMALVLPGASPAEAVAVAERARAAVARLHLDAGRVSVSVGVASTRVPCEPSDLAEAADRCLYEAKRGGRDRVVGATMAGDRVTA
jgi:diguanylate cyclase (GGDEF)-like protein